MTRRISRHCRQAARWKRFVRKRLVEIKKPYELVFGHPRAVENLLDGLAQTIECFVQPGSPYLLGRDKHAHRLAVSNNCHRFAAGEEIGSMPVELFDVHMLHAALLIRNQP